MNVSLLAPFTLTSAEKHAAKLRLAERLREARLSRNLTQAQVAAALGQPQSYVSNKESGERGVSAVELQEFMKYYDLPINFFWVI